MGKGLKALFLFALFGFFVPRAYTVGYYPPAPVETHTYSKDFESGAVCPQSVLQNLSTLMSFGADGKKMCGPLFEDRIRRGHPFTAEDQSKIDKKYEANPQAAPQMVGQKRYDPANS